MTTEADIHFGPGFGKTNKYSEAKQGNGIMTIPSWYLDNQWPSNKTNNESLSFKTQYIHIHRYYDKYTCRFDTKRSQTFN